MWTLVDYINSSWLWWTVTIAYIAIVLGVIIVVVSENRNPVKSLAWVTVLLVVPAVGLLLYLIFGRNIQSKRIISRRNRRKLKRQQEVNLPRLNTKRKPTDLPIQTVLLANSLQGSILFEDNNVTLLNNGKDKIDLLLKDIASAKSYINIEYYIFSDDEVGRRVAELLAEKARQGVKVRMIYDSVGSFKTPRRFFRRLKRAGVEAYPFFEVVFPPFGTRINWRNHRKIVVIDGKIGYIGGMNIARRYVDGGKMFDIWRDLHLRITGPGVTALQQSFAVDWNFMGQPLLMDPLASRDENPDMESPQGEIRGASLQLLTGGPVNQWMNLTLMFQHLISTAKKCVWLQTPYFLPTEGLLHALQVAALAKVDVRIMLPARSDSDMLSWASFSYIRDCLRSGIKVYLFEGGMLHSKAIIIDDQMATVGSTNFDFRSFEHNFEANMIVYSRDFNSAMKRQFVADQRMCRRVNPEQWRRRPRLQKALESFMRLFSPIL